MSEGWVKIGESGFKKGVPNLGMFGGGGVRRNGPAVSAGRTAGRWFGPKCRVAIRPADTAAEPNRRRGYRRFIPSSQQNGFHKLITYRVPGNGPEMCLSTGGWG